MDFSNEKGVRKLRVVLLIIGVCWLLSIAVFIFVEMFLSSVISAGLFLVAVFTVALLNFKYVNIKIERNKLIIRYYSIFSVDRLFQMFEFPVDLLRNVEVRQHFLGLKWDLRFTVRVRKGLADYPWISLSSIPFRERSNLILELKKLIPPKHPS
jgi:hypothetical protein